MCLKAMRAFWSLRNPGKIRYTCPGEGSIRLSSTEFPLMRKRTYGWLGVVAVAVLIAVWALVTTPGPVFYFSLGWIVVIAVLLWFGNRFMSHALDSLLPWN